MEIETLPHLPLSIDLTQQLRLQYVFPLLILLRRLKRLIILPPHRLLALPARDVPHDMSPGRHAPLDGLSLRDVYDGVKEVGFAMLAAEVLLGGGVSWGAWGGARM